MNPKSRSRSLGGEYGGVGALLGTGRCDSKGLMAPGSYSSLLRTIGLHSFFLPLTFSWAGQGRLPPGMLGEFYGHVMGL